jgi:hypothetical protein
VSRRGADEAISRVDHDEAVVADVRVVDPADLRAVCGG